MLDALEQQLRCGLSDFLGGLRHHRDRRVDHRLPGGLIETHQRHFTRHGDLSIAHGLKDTSGQQAVAGEDRIRAIL